MTGPQAGTAEGRCATQLPHGSAHDHHRQQTIRQRPPREALRRTPASSLGALASNGSKGLRQVPARKGLFGCVRSLNLDHQKSSFVKMIDQKLLPAIKHDGGPFPLQKLAMLGSFVHTTARAQIYLLTQRGSIKCPLGTGTSEMSPAFTSCRSLLWRQSAAR